MSFINAHKDSTEILSELYGVEHILSLKILIENCKIT